MRADSSENDIALLAVLSYNFPYAITFFENESKEADMYEVASIVYTIDLLWNESDAGYEAMNNKAPSHAVVGYIVHDTDNDWHTVIHPVGGEVHHLMMR